MSVAVNDFVKRQIISSGKTYSKTLSFEQIADHARVQMGKKMYREGYRDGVRIVIADKSLNSDFVCPFVKLDEGTKLVSKLVCRREEEEFYIQTRALSGVPVETGKVELILYRHDVLMENNENTTTEEWEVISINAIAREAHCFDVVLFVVAVRVCSVKRMAIFYVFHSLLNLYYLLIFLNLIYIIII